MIVHLLCNFKLISVKTEGNNETKNTTIDRIETRVNGVIETDHVLDSHSTAIGHWLVILGLKSGKTRN